MRSVLLKIAECQVRETSWCRSRTQQMPRRYLRVLPARTRPSLFAGD